MIAADERNEYGVSRAFIPFCFRTSLAYLTCPDSQANLTSSAFGVRVTFRCPLRRRS